MKNLAEAVIDHWWWIQQCEEELTEAFGDDFMGDHYEGMILTMDGLDATELQTIRDVAAARLRSYEDNGPDEWGFSRRSQLRPEEREFLEGLINWGQPAEAAQEEEGTAT
ncbi:hypothetical protein [Dongia sp.]|uniref:hypothetical protein n=1 Tax=Dongia sp. TaxID=1977262 RepID=UPI0035B04849